ncbi:MAG: hypothetical protein LBR61_03565 [Synergistaceae bacterium]|jgi:hypothetical protein|nr:hypothetical protein [Synergistaceae bacterium]
MSDYWYWNNTRKARQAAFVGNGELFLVASLYSWYFFFISRYMLFPFLMAFITSAVAVACFWCAVFMRTDGVIGDRTPVPEDCNPWSNVPGALGCAATFGLFICGGHVLLFWLSYRSGYPDFWTPAVITTAIFVLIIASLVIARIVAPESDFRLLPFASQWRRFDIYVREYLWPLGEMPVFRSFLKIFSTTWLLVSAALTAMNLIRGKPYIALFCFAFVALPAVAFTGIIFWPKNRR